MLAFGYFSRQAASCVLYYRLSVQAEVVRAGEVTKENHKECVTYLNNIRALRKICVRPRSPSPLVQRVLDLRRGISQGESATWGTNAERARFRHSVFGMVRRLGVIHIFLTLSSDAAGTYVVCVNGGELTLNWSTPLMPISYQAKPNAAELLDATRINAQNTTIRSHDCLSNK